MAIITKIEEQKNKKRVNIFVDDAFFCGLNKETAIIFHLKVGKEIDEKELQEAVFASEVKRAFEKASDYLGDRMHTKKELSDKLLKKGFEKKVIEDAIKKLEEYHYVDDRIFAKQFIQQNKRYSKRMLEIKLKEKGVSSNLISEFIGLKAEETELELCKKYALSYAKGKDFSDKTNVQKLYSSLARRGFSFEIIKSACKNIIQNCEDEEIFDDFD